MTSAADSFTTPRYDGVSGDVGGNAVTVLTPAVRRPRSPSRTGVDRTGAVTIQVPEVPTRAAYRVVKRVIDLTGAIVGLVLSLPLMAVCAVLVKLHDGGPILYRQTRVGERGREFRIWKFRTMVPNADTMKVNLLDQNRHEDNRTFKILSDPRITPVGRLLRRLSLDELPQFWNVLWGEMSLVGPRPPVPSEVALYQRRDLTRLAVKPGITCIWQVSGRSNLDFSRQVELDIEYIERRSVWLDLKLLALTLPAVFRGDGAA